MKSLEKILRCYDMSIFTKIRVTQAMIFTENIWKQKLDFKKRVETAQALLKFGVGEDC